MTAYADCPDARFIFEWRVASAYETLADEDDKADIESSTSSSERALYYYLLFWAKVANDL